MIEAIRGLATLAVLFMAKKEEMDRKKAARRKGKKT